MKEVNLISILSAYKKLSSELFQSYLKYHSIKIKNDELDDLYILVRDLLSCGRKVDVFDKFFFGFTIPQIGKEFDLLRIDNETVINIELKRISTPEKIQKQLLRNKYYLGFLKKQIFSFTYIVSEKKVYGIDNNHNLVESDIKQLCATLESQKVHEIKNIENYFNPSNYLVSPFNSTLEFIKGNYFLTTQQEEIKNLILLQVNLDSYSILSIKGKAGTGKTLLTYDIVKVIQKQKKTLIVHCGFLNNGHVQLRDEFGWNIISAKFILNHDLSKYELIIIDEAQRIYRTQLDHIIKEVKRYSSSCIFSFDGQQTLIKWEINNNIEAEIEKEVTVKSFELTNKIRTNKEVASFIHCLFNENWPIEKINYTNIKINYFNDYPETKDFLIQQRREGWKIINYTPSSAGTLPYEYHKIHEESDNAHKVIGQEFDCVVAVIDPYFYYKNGKLSTRNYGTTPYYHPTKMLFQIVSRTRIKLSVVIVNNQEILNRCLNILNQ